MNEFSGDEISVDDFFSPNNTTLTNLIAGQVYDVAVFSKSEYGKKSSEYTFTQSMYTDVIAGTNIKTGAYSLELEVEFESGVGRDIFVQLEGVDVEFTDAIRKSFALATTLFSSIFLGKTYQLQSETSLYLFKP